MCEGCGCEGGRVEEQTLTLSLTKMERMARTCEHSTWQMAHHAQVNRATKSFGHLLAELESRPI